MGFCGSIVDKLKEGNLKVWGRWMAIIFALGSGVTSCFGFGNCFAVSLGGLFIAIWVGFLELPFLCAKMDCMQTCLSKISYLDKFLVKFILHFGVGLGQCFLLDTKDNNGDHPTKCWWLALWGSWLMLAGLMYLGAQIKGETQTEDDRKASGLGVDSKKIKRKAASNVAKKAAGGII